MKLFLAAIYLLLFWHSLAFGANNTEEEAPRDPLHKPMKQCWQLYHNPYLTLEEVLRSLASYGDIARLAHYFIQERETLNGFRQQMRERSLKGAFLQSIRERDYASMFTLLLLGGTTVAEEAPEKDRLFVIHARFFVRQCARVLNARRLAKKPSHPLEPLDPPLGR